MVVAVGGLSVYIYRLFFYFTKNYNQFSPDIYILLLIDKLIPGDSAQKSQLLYLYTLMVLLSQSPRFTPVLLSLYKAAYG